MKLTDLPSPNYDSRDGHDIDMLVLHYTGMRTAREALERLCNRDAKVSAHYVVDEDGTLYRLVDEECRAWHAGISAWREHNNINQRAIGIEIVNPGHEFGYRPFPPVQMRTVATLCKDIIYRNRIPARNVVGHSDVAPARKEDPGELFDWKTLASVGVGLWPKPGLGISDSGLEKDTFSSPIPNPQSPIPLQKYGYDTTDLPKAITAFQRHFRPDSLTGQWDSECEGLLAALLKMV